MAAGGRRSTRDGSRGEEAARAIRRMIFDGELRPGERVPQDAIASRVGVSRIPIREAIIALEREGWVRVEMHRGAFVSALDEASVRDHYDLYALVYGFSARRALQRSPTALVDDLREIHTRLLSAEDPVEIGRCTVAFNAALVDAAASSRTKVLLRSMTGLVPGDFFTLVADAVDVEREGSTAVLRALEDGDGDAAAVAYGHMMSQMADKVVTVFRSRGLLSAGPGSASIEGSQRGEHDERSARRSTTRG